MSKSISKKAATAATTKPYTIAEHSKRFEKWAGTRIKSSNKEYHAEVKSNIYSHKCASHLAARAASTSPVCRFKIPVGILILEQSGFSESFVLPTATKFDAWHSTCRQTVINEAKKQGRTFTHGIAAKLINVYLKARYIVGHSHPPDYVHPPIDRILLNKLAAENVGGFQKDWKGLKDFGWSNFDFPKYEDVIKKVRIALKGKPLWSIEEHWNLS